MNNRQIKDIFSSAYNYFFSKAAPEEIPLSEIDELTLKLDELKLQRSKIINAQYQTEQIGTITRANLFKPNNLKPEEKEALENAWRFIQKQIEAVEARLLTINYLGWENEALDEYRQLSALDYTNGAVNLEITERIIKFVIGRGEELKQKWTKLQENAELTKTAGEVLERIEQIEAVLSEFLEDVKTAETEGKVMLALKNVRQVDSSSPISLPESRAAESMKILQRLQARPLDDNKLRFEQYRIEALEELSEK